MNARPVQSKTPSTEADAALRALAELFANVKEWHSSYSQYLLERIDGELVFRQTEADAAVKNAIASLSDPNQTSIGRRIIKLGKATKF